VRASLEKTKGRETNKEENVVNKEEETIKSNQV
jgi:hypothetical protein